MKSMIKNSFLILMGLVVFSFASCEKDSESSNSASIVGEWTISSASVVATINDVNLVQYFVDALGLSQEEAQSYSDMFTEGVGEMSGTINFKADGTYTSTSTDTDGTTTESGTYKLNADKTKITMDEGTENEGTMDIVTLTASKLELSITETEVSDMDGDGANDTLKFKVTMVLTR